jgi:mannosyltransferase OCH1-like enzyme
LTYLPAFTTDGGKGALSNNIMGGQPEHPWFHLLTENLVPYNWNWILPYIIISYTSGQWFVTAMWEKYHSLLRDDGTVNGFEEMGDKFRPLYHMLMEGRPDADPWVFFTQTRGGTWTNWDSAWFAWVGDNIVMIVLGIAVIVGLIIWSCVWCVRRSSRSKGYQALPLHD